MAKYGSRDFMNSEYVYVGSPEETVLETYFVLISRFNFDRAKEQCEREKETKSGTWCEFMFLLSRLSALELSYNSLNFIDRTWLGKREHLSSTYDILSQELKKIHEIYLHRKSGTSFSWEKKMAELSMSLIEYIQARKELINFYLSLDARDSFHVNYLHSNQLLKDIKDRHNKCFQNIFMKPIRLSYWTEVGVLMDLIKAHQSLADWLFLPTILSLQSAQDKLKGWNGLEPSGLPTIDLVHKIASIRSRANSIPSQSVPVLYQWLCTFHNTLLSKCSLYFYHNLITNNPLVQDNKFVAHKLNPDFLLKFNTIIKLSPPQSCICLIFDSTGLENFKGSTYQLPSSPCSTLTGLNTYPIMMSVPLDFDFLPHKPNIVSMIMSHDSQTPGCGISMQPDNKLHCTYHLAQVDVRVTLVVVMGTNRSKDQDVITGPLIDIVNQLRLHHIVQILN